MPAPSPFEDRERTDSAAIQRASLAQSQAAARQAGYVVRLDTILCQWRHLWRKTSRATRRLVEPL
jgi:hypothetical protein